MLKKRILRKRHVYDFTLRLIHQYYVHHYNEIKQKLGYEELLAPSIGSIENCYEILKLGAPNQEKPGKLLQFGFCTNIDQDELSMTKDLEDFEPSFLAYVRLSCEQEKRTNRSTALLDRIIRRLDVYEQRLPSL